MVKNTFCRYEKKLLIPSEIEHDLQTALLEYMVPDEYNIDGKPYEICNLYFDDEHDSVIRHSISKPHYKEKLRLRSYGTPQSMDSKVFLEIKKKCDGIGTKRRVAFTLADAYTYLNTGTHPVTKKYINGQVLDEIDYYLKVHPSEPKVYISYLRNAFFGKEDSNVRITFDKEIITRRYDLALEKGRYGDLLLPDGKILLEVKFLHAVPLWLAAIMSDFNLSFSSYSKYGREFLKHSYEEINENNYRNCEMGEII